MKLRWTDIQDADFRLDDAENALGIVIQSQTKSEDWAICPIPDHPGDRSDAHFSINRDKLVWNCFVCGRGGSMPRLVQEINDMDKDASINWLAQFSDADPENMSTEKLIQKVQAYAHRDLRVPMERDPDLPWFPPRAIKAYEENLDELYRNQDWLKDKWSIGQRTAREFHLGFAEPYDHKHRFSGPAVIIPHFWNHNLVGWQARWTEPPWSAGEVVEKFPKYVNTDDFPKKYTLYNWDRVRALDAPLIIVESFASVLRLHEYGLLSVATFGDSVSQQQIKTLATYRGPLYLAYDNDDAGQRAQGKVMEELQQHGPVFLVPPPRLKKESIGDQDFDEVQRLLRAAKPSHMLGF